MFHDGDLQSGISRAIQEQKLVACFVREDDSEESSEWENSYLASVKDELSSKTVILKIDQTSQEAGFLSAFCPISKAPTLVIINNGQVLEKLEGGIGQDEFTERLGKALGIDMKPSSQPNEDPNQTEAENEDASTQASAPSRPSQSEQATSPQDSQNVQDLFPGRAERLESDHQKRQAAEKSERAARARARRKETEDAQSAAADDPNKPRATGETAEKERARQSWINQQKQRKDEARQERQRILDAIENDKQERKARAQRERSDAPISSPLDPSTSPTPTQPSGAAAPASTAGAGDSCNLQIRLFDGTSIRHRFAASETLASGVRDWISHTATARDAADAPYSFRLLLAPLPSRSLGVPEEHQTLRELGLIPNSTLVLVPVQGYTSAYAAGTGAGGGYLGTAVNAGYGLVGAGFGMLASLLAYVPGFGGGGRDPGEGEERRGPAAASSARVKVKTLADQRAEEAAERESRQAEFYNGNSSAFEGRKDDAGDDA